VGTTREVRRNKCGSHAAEHGDDQSGNVIDELPLVMWGLFYPAQQPGLKERLGCEMSSVLLQSDRHLEQFYMIVIISLNNTRIL
jgi:hypothetical protein